MMMPFRNPNPPKRQRGMAIVMAIFLLIVVALLVGALSRLVLGETSDVQNDVRAVRARLAAQAGLDWASWQILDPKNEVHKLDAINVGNVGAEIAPVCFASPTTIALPASLAEFTVSVTCVRTPLTTDTPNYFEEDQSRVVVFDVEVTATFGVVNAPDRVMRIVAMRIEACKDPSSTPPNFSCDAS